MQTYQREFLELCLDRGVLRFGDFTLKSGRNSPYFFNLGRIDSGLALAQLGRAYAQALDHDALQYDMLFGPAYKGIALAAATAMALSVNGLDIPWAYNRKEAKNHGETGKLVGAALHGNVLVIDDVITAGTATREALQLIHQHNASPAAVLVALDRCERSSGNCTAATQLTQEFGIPVISIATVHDLVALTAGRSEFAEHHRKLRDWIGMNTLQQ